MKKLVTTLAIGALALSSTAFASWQQSSIGGFSKVHIYTPSTTSTEINDQRALLVVLHGCTQSSDVYKNNAGLAAIAEEFGYVIAAPEAQHKSGMQCWHYWDSAANQARNVKDYKNIATLVDTITGGNYNVDPKQVYLAGLSSGATFTSQTGCILADKFAGVVDHQGPGMFVDIGSIGDMNLLKNPGQGNPATMAQRCISRAGDYSPHLDTQVYIASSGTSDTTVDPGWGNVNTKARNKVYGIADAVSKTGTVKEGSYTANWKTYGNGVVTEIMLQGLAHSWPAGAEGSAASYVSPQSISLGRFIAQTFNENNRRVERTPPVDCSKNWPAPSPAQILSTEVSDNSVTYTIASQDKVNSYLIQGDISQTVQVKSNNGVDTVRIGSLKPATQYDLNITPLHVCAVPALSPTTSSFTTLEQIIVYESITTNATDHYNSGRLDVSGYIAMGGKYGYMNPFTMWKVNGAWTDVEPTEGGGNNEGNNPPPPAIPATPANPYVGNITDTSALITWNASVGATGYKVTVNGETAQVEETQFALTQLDPNTNYVVEIRAFNKHGESNPAVRNFKTEKVKEQSCVQYTSTNTAHYNASPKRANATLVWWTYQYSAVGTNQDLGSAYTTTTLHSRDSGQTWATGSCN